MNRAGKGWGSATRKGLRLLWVWWWFFSLLLLVTWTCASWNYCQACWSGGAAQVLPRIQSLREDLVALQEAQTNAALSVWNQFLSGTLTRSEWAKLGQEGPRFLRFYYVDQANRPIWPDLNGSAPPRLLKADSEPSLLWVRSAAGASDRYLARVSRNNKGEWLVVEADLDFIFGAWLAARTQGLSVQVQPAGWTDGPGCPSGDNCDFE